MVAILYAVAVGMLVIYGFNLMWLAIEFLRFHRRSDHTSSGTPHGLEELPFVTVQLPIFNERLVAERLIDACAAVEYPSARFEIQVLDDSTDDTTEIVGRSVLRWREAGLQIQHIQRMHRTGFKAGALQHGLESARGSLIAIFDADFVPPRNFLRDTVPHFADQKVGMVQSRWTYLNRDWSVLTKLQALGLDAHFAVEQVARNRSGCFINFNGTAGVWRRQCIEDAGGWHADTLTEDLDLSYRAQIRGWRFKFVGTLESASELPISLTDLRTQQFRWTKGTIQTALKTVRSLLRYGPSLKTKAEGLIHLTNHLVFPFVLLAGLLHAPLAYLKGTVNSPGESYFAALGIGLVAFAGFFLVQLFAQRSLHDDWLRRLTLFPLFVAGSMGFSINNTLAVADALSGRASAFERTPKHGIVGRPSPARHAARRPRTGRLPIVVVLEMAMAIYCIGGLAVIMLLGEWAAVPFQVFLAAGFGLVSYYSLAQVVGR
jgi:cellulose synthase/poly-beta-1,6-N-acetylglucosamine synthase-like glycosyltransferase